MEFRHRPVMPEQCIEGLNINPDGIYIDGTLGGGGHSEEICKRLSAKGTLIGIDRDRDALNASSERLEKYECNKYFVQSNYSDVRQVLSELGIQKADGALLDLGVSSFQLDNPQRGFSYMNDAPLDMRMSQDDDFTAYDVVNDYDRGELTRIIGKYGEERWAQRIADFIVRGRQDKPIEPPLNWSSLSSRPYRRRQEGQAPIRQNGPFKP